MTNDVAIVGMACRFPEANSLSEFMSNLRNGRDSVSEIGPDRWNVDEFYAADISAPNRSNSKWCGQIAGVNEFDHGFFNISPAEARELDPQQRLLLQETYHCIEDAGIHPDILKASATSVHVGVMATDAMLESGRLDVPTSRYACLGNYPCILSNRLSYVFGWRGISQTIDSACASSLVAIHEARRQLLSGDCDHAIAAAVSLNLHPWKYIAFSKSHMLSPDGRCKTFDASANGYVPGDGVGVLLLKRLDDALRDRDHIRGIIKGSAVNHGGHGRAIAEPRLEAQRDVILAAYRDAGISPATVSYIEAHGTGTVLGDPIEVQALTQAFAGFATGRGSCKIGSVKSNIGHLEAAAGMAGVIKVLLMMEQRCVFKSLHVDTPNPIIDFAQTPFSVAREPSEWAPSQSGLPLRAGISSFGMGGVNSHVVVEEPPAREVPPRKKLPDGSAGPRLFLLSAKSQTGLDRLIRSWVEFVQTPQFAALDFEDICSTLMFGREMHGFRFGVMVKDPGGLADALRSATTNCAEPGSWHLQVGDCAFEGFAPFRSAFNSNALFRQETRTVSALLAPDAPCLSADQWAASDQELYSLLVVHAYLTALTRCGIRLGSVQATGGGWQNALPLLKMRDIREACGLIRGEVTVLPLRRPTVALWDSVRQCFISPFNFDAGYVERLFGSLDVSQPVLDSYRAKAGLLRAYQVTFAKYLSEWERLFSSRGLLFREFMSNSGVHAGGTEDGLSPATVTFLVIASSLKRLYRRSGLPCEDFAFDSRLDEITDLLADGVLTPEGLLDFFQQGNAGAGEIARSLNEMSWRLDPNNAYRHLRQSGDVPAYIDCSAHRFDDKADMPAAPVIPGRARLLRFGYVAAAAGSASPSAIEIAADPGDHLGLLLSLWKSGEQLAWGEIFEQRAGYAKVSLPNNPFDPIAIRSSAPVRPVEAAVVAQSPALVPASHQLIDSHVTDDAGQRFLKVLHSDDALIRDHVIDNNRIFAAAASLEMMRAAADMLGLKPGVTIHNVTWIESLIVADDKTIEVRSGVAGDPILLLQESNGASGRLVQASIRSAPATRGVMIPQHPETLRLDEAEPGLQSADIYSFFEQRGSRYGVAYQTVRKLSLRDRSTVAHLKAGISGPGWDKFYLDPTLIDGAFQAAIASSELERAGPEARFIPFELAELSAWAPVREECYVYITPSGTDDHSSSPIRRFDLSCYDKSGRMAAQLRGLAVKNVLWSRQEGAAVVNTADGPELHAGLGAGTGGGGFEAFQQQLLRTVEAVIGCGEGDVDADSDISDYGLDSVSFTDLADMLNEKFALDLGPALFFEHSTFAGIAARVWKEYPRLSEFLPVAQAAATSPVGSPPAPANEPRADASIAADIGASPAHRRPEAANEPIAIIGMGAVLPGSRNLDEFWQHLEAGDDLISEIPPDRWRWQDHYGDPAAAGHMTNVKWGGFIPDADKFDAGFFNISRRVADFMDPQQRILLQTVWKTIEHAGYDPGTLSGARVAVFVGVAFTDYDELIRARRGPIEAHMATGIANSILSNRISHHFDFRGASETIDTACSGSLVALHRAIRTLRSGESELAVAGGVHVMASPTMFVAFSKAGMLSPTGRCRTFDHLADGYVRGEGVGTLLLKPLSKAQRDGDVIHAVILGSAVNHGGHANTLTTPAPSAQTDLIWQSCRDAGIDVGTISYVEAHGTGTPLGDPIEISALKAAFAGEGTSCGIGSVKTNIGHLEAASGVAGVLKVVLALKHRKIPAHLNFERLSPHISLQGSPFYIVDRATDWERRTDRQGALIPRRAGVSSFGFGGTNAHVVLEEYDPPVCEASIAAVPRLFLLSALDQDRLREYCQLWLDFVKKVLTTRDPAHHAAILRDAAYTLRAGRTVMASRIAIVASRLEELHDDLECYLRSSESKTLYQSGGLEDRNLRALLRGETGEQLKQLILARADPDQLAALFVSGAGFDPKVLEQGDARRMPLPTYPFERLRCWIEHEQEPSPHPEVEVPADELSSCFIAKWVRADRRDRQLKTVSATAARVVWVACPPESRSLRSVLSAHHQHDHLCFAGHSDGTARQAKRPDVVYFGAREQHGEYADVGFRHEQCVVALFRLLKLLITFDWTNGRCTLVVVTSSAYRCDGAESCDPNSACVAGFAKGLAKDLPWLDLMSIDLDADGWRGEPSVADREALLKELSEPMARTPMGPEIAIRRGHRFVRKLFPLHLPDGTQSLFKARGTYLLFGGMGNVGFKTARYLAHTGRANLVLAGRSDLTDDMRRRLKQLEALGGCAIYIQADVRDAGSIRAAVAAVKARFGSLDGVIHSAMIYDETAVGELTEDGLRAVLAPKVEGSVALGAALEKEPLDFLIVYSSAQVFTATAGRCHYTAACAFQDAFADRLGRQLPFPVKIVNWGFWSEADAAEQRQQAKTAQGVRLLTENAGIGALDRLAGRQSVQVAVFEVSSEIQELMGVDRSRRLTFRAAPGSSFVGATEERFRRKAVLSGVYRTAAFDRWVALSLLSSFRSQGLFLSPTESWSVVSLEAAMSMAPIYARLLVCLLEILRDAGFIVFDGRELRPTSRLQDVGVLSDLRSLDTLKDRLLDAQPEARPFVELLDRCLSGLPAVFRGSTAATELIFPGGAIAHVEGIYQENSVAKVDNEHVAALVLDHVEARLGALGREGDRRRLRILEIGAGTGGTSASVLAALLPYGEKLSYTYSDVSAAFVSVGRRKFEEGFPFVTYRRFDVEADPANWVEDLGAYDILIAANVLHATADIRQTLSRAKSLLRSHGWLVLLEATEASPFMTLTFGLLDGWWRFEDAQDRLANSPLLSVASWKRILNEVGFVSAVIGPPPERDAANPILRQSILIGESDGIVAETTQSSAGASPQKIGDFVFAPTAPLSRSPDRDADAQESVRLLITKALERVLRLEQGGVASTIEFQRLGLDSILGLELSRELFRSLGVDLKLSVLFEHSTVETLADHVSKCHGLGSGAAAVDGAIIATDSRGESFPVSAGQAGLWWNYKLAPHSYAYNVPLVFKVPDGVDVRHLREAWRVVCGRHPSLRTVLQQQGDSIRQTAHPYRYDAFEQIAVAEQTEVGIASIVTALAERPFNLETGPLARLSLLTGARGESLIVILIHHAVTDGRSLGTIVEELDRSYFDLKRGEAPLLPDSGASYRDFVEWQQAMLEGSQGEASRARWLAELQRPLPRLDLPRRDSLAKSPSGKGEIVSFEVDKALRDATERLGIICGTSVSAVLLSTFFLLLHRHTNQDDLAIGVPVIGRPDSRFERTVGLFANMTVVRVALTDSGSFSDLLSRTWDKLLGAMDHGDYPYVRLLEERRHGGDFADAGQLFHAGFYFQREFPPAAESLLLERLLQFDQKGEFDLVLDVAPAADRFVIHFKFNPGIYDRDIIAQLSSHYLTLLSQVVREPGKSLRHYRLMSPEEELTVLARGRGVDAPLAKDKTFYDLFEEQVRRTPDAVAVIHGEQRLTYRELEHRANRCARLVRNAGIEFGMTVAVCIKHGPELLIALLGLLKAGVIYVPLDASYPRDRLSYMIDDAVAVALLTERSFDVSSLDYRGKVLLIEEEPEAGAPLAIARRRLSETAYIIYTSGSTGHPKGVLNTHRGVVNFLYGMIRELDFGATDRTLWITSICFDPSVLEIYLPLIAGGSVEIISPECLKDGIALKRALQSTTATVIQATPATFKMLFAAGWTRECDARILCGGEAMTPELAAELLRRSDVLWNVFGPTEATVWNAMARIYPDRPITIGRPIQNIQYYALDSDLRPVPVGVTGELYIAGDGLAAGYHGLAETGQTSFIDHAFDSAASARMYKSGDLVRLRSDGQFEFLGRADNQVKLRGYRIELGGVEAALKRNPAIGEAAVVVRNDSEGHGHLHAFLQPRLPGDLLTAEGVNAALRISLPAYMLPSSIHVLNELPLTPSRKIDRKLLASASLDKFMTATTPTSRSEAGPVRPSGLKQGLAEELAILIAPVVNVNAGLLRDDQHLGEYGFDSIRYTSLSGVLRARFGVEIKPTVFYEHSTISAIASYLIAHHIDCLTEFVLHRAHTERDTPRTAFPESPTPAGSARPAIHQEQPEAAAEPIAVIGIAGRFPQSDNIREFWNNLLSARDLISAVPGDRWDSGAHYGDPRTEQNKTRAVWGGFVTDVDKFDAAFFGISAREAELMDPQHRLFLQTAWHVIEDAGYKPSDLAGTATAVVVGAGSFDYWQLQCQSGQPIDNYTLTGLSHAAIANRVSFALDLKGPSGAVDAACSSSLVAVHRAVKMIRSRECEVAIAGGVSLMLSPFLTIAADKAGMMSPVGRCKTFDAAADGYVRGEGVGAVLLKRLSAAERDGDNVYAVIRGSAENHSGRTSSFTAPNPASQAELLMRAYADAGTDPSTVTYLETHGTGTELGDPIEIDALKKVFRFGRADSPTNQAPNCGLASVKTNIGHLEVAAGIAGLVKVLLAIKHGVKPGILHHKETNPLIDLSGTSLYINTSNQPWQRLRDSRGAVIPRRAGISSFGFGGAQAHVVVEEYVAPPRQVAAACRPRIIILSAKHPKALAKSAGQLAQHLLSLAHDDDGRQETAAIMTELLECENAGVDDDELWSALRNDGTALARFASRISGTFGAEVTAEQLLLRAGSFDELLQFLRGWRQGELLADIAYTLQVGREAFDHRLAIVARDLEEAAHELLAMVASDPSRHAGCEGEAGELMQRWLSGAKVEWLSLYEGEQRRRVSLPAYCFARVRHWVAQTGAGAPDRTPDAARPLAGADSVPKHYWRPEWVRRELAIEKGRSTTDVYLVVANGGDLANLLRTRGARVIEVRRSSAFAIINDETVEIDAANAAGFVRLIGYLKAQSLLPRRVIHVGAEAGLAAEFKPALERTILSTFRLIQALDGAGVTELQWLHVYRRVPGAPDALNTAISGFGRTLRQERPGYRIKCVELASGHSAARDEDVDALLQEFDSGEGDSEIRYDAGGRYVRDFRPAEPLEGRVHPLRYGGTYLITGGMGAVGRIIARHLSEVWRANVVLCGRSRPNEALTHAYIRTDVADEAEVQAMVSDIKRRFGRLDGVFHAAGIIRDARLEKKTEEDLMAVLAPKVFGALNLDRATRDEDLCCFVMFSSLSALIGNPGQSDYATANAFMDDFATSRRELVASGARRGTTVSINFPLWRYGGMRVNSAREQEIEAAVGSRSIDRVTALAMLNEALLADTPQVVAAAGARDRIEHVLRYGWAVPVANSPMQVPARTPASDVTQNKDIERGLARELCGMAAEILKANVEDIDPAQPMRSYGLDSLSIIDLSAKINRRFDIETAPTLFYENPTIASLAQQMLQAWPDRVTDAYGRTDAAAHVAAAAADRDMVLPAALPDCEPIAIIGMSCTFPGSSDADAFWENLAAGRDLIAPYPPERSGAVKQEPFAGGFMQNVDNFDAAFFQISDHEARLMDPQQRIFLQTVWKAIENAGYKASDLSGSDTGLFVGVATADYIDVLRDNDVGLSEYTASGISHCILANRISYLLNLRGPSEPVDTGCSSALVAIHRGVAAIRRGECGRVIAGGVNVILSPFGNRIFEAAGVLSKSGMCRPFDAGADGYVRGEGSGAVVLKRLRDAERDRDNIYGVIRGSAQNHGGNSNGLTAPNPKAQAAVIIKALRDAQIDPGTVSYIEAHGTGTLLGDSVEIQGLVRAFEATSRGSTDEWRCHIGSVKGNIGHLEAASGIASVAKVLLAMKRRKLPATLHFEKLNPFISARHNPFHVVGATIPWERRSDHEGRPAGLRAGVSSFGFGGTNAHVVLEEYIDAAGVGTATPAPQALILSGKSPARLRRYAEDFIGFLTGPDFGFEAPQPQPSLADIAFTLQVGREEMTTRLAVVASDLVDLVAKLRAFLLDTKPLPAGIFVGDTSAARAEHGAARTFDGTGAGLWAAADLWVKGASIDWSSWHDLAHQRRISLPTYPFEETACRIEHTARTRDILGGPGDHARLAIHPLLHVNLSSWRTVRFLSVFSADAPLLTDHVVRGEKLMPGAALLEMALAGASHAAERPARKLRKVVWPRRVALSPGETGFSVELRVDRDRFEILSMTPGKLARICAGQVEFGPDDERGAVEEWVDLKAIAARCDQATSGDAFYAALVRSGFAYGPGLRAVQSLRSGKSEALALVRATETSAVADWVLHPSIMDAALQVTYGIPELLGSSRSAPLIPFAIAELEVFSPLPRSCYVHAAVSVACIGQPGQSLKTFDLMLVEESGKVAAKIFKYAVRSMDDRRPIDRGSNGDAVDDDRYRTLLTRLHKGNISPRDAIRIYRADLRRDRVGSRASFGLAGSSS